ncbi:unnamed protein product [Boreogadus saida]
MLLATNLGAVNLPFFTPPPALCSFIRLPFISSNHCSNPLPQSPSHRPHCSHSQKGAQPHQHARATETRTARDPGSVEVRSIQSPTLLLQITASETPPPPTPLHPPQPPNPLSSPEPPHSQSLICSTSSSCALALSVFYFLYISISMQPRSDIASGAQGFLLPLQFSLHDCFIIGQPYVPPFLFLAPSRSLSSHWIPWSQSETVVG